MPPFMEVVQKTSQLWENHKSSVVFGQEKSSKIHVTVIFKCWKKFVNGYEPMSL